MHHPHHGLPHGPHNPWIPGMFGPNPHFPHGFHFPHGPHWPHGPLWHFWPHGPHKPHGPHHHEPHEPHAPPHNIPNIPVQKDNKYNSGQAKTDESKPQEEYFPENGGNFAEGENGYYNYNYEDGQYNSKDQEYNSQDPSIQQGQQQFEVPNGIHEHPLNYVPVLNALCTICQQNNGNQPGYQCGQCNVSLCINCSKRAFYGDKKTTLHPHPLELKYRVSWRCNICNILYQKTSSFFCRQCDFDICASCYLPY